MIAVNCTVTRGEAAVCVVFNVVCGRVRFNYDIERGRTAVGRGARFGYLYMAQPIYIYPYRGSISQADVAQRMSEPQTRNGATAHATLKRRSRALHADAACDPV